MEVHPSVAPEEISELYTYLRRYARGRTPHAKTLRLGTFLLVRKKQFDDGAPLSLPLDPNISFNNFIGETGGLEAYSTQGGVERDRIRRDEELRKGGFWRWSLLSWRISCLAFNHTPEWAYLLPADGDKPRVGQEHAIDPEANIRRNFRRDGLNAMRQVRAIAGIP
jgi:hypothetical protein